MFDAIRNIYRLTKAGLTLAWHGVGFIPESVSLPGPLRTLRETEEDGGRREAPGRGFLARSGRSGPAISSLANSWRLAPTRGPATGRAFGSLRDRLPPFPAEQAKAELEPLSESPGTTFTASSAPLVAAASIAQVHKASSTPTADRSCRG